ncbi:MAG: Hsp20/alpha crystallin family protein [Candidatus Latescibacteria bacterium]|nr:Hsp20/alpha crystallin family protein [Candidatus Latescibacterota bacterium]
MTDFNDPLDEMDLMIDLKQIHKSFMNVTSRHWKPPTDIYESQDNYFIYIELAGMKKHEIYLTYENGYLIVSGNRKQFYCPNISTLHRIEIENGKFMRKIKLNVEIIEKNIEAEYLDGILKITIPKRRDE